MKNLNININEILLYSLSKVAFSFSKINEVGKDTIVAIGFWGLLGTLIAMHQRGRSFKFLTRLRIVGDFSYSLYILHFPVLVLFNAILLNHTNNIMPMSFLYVWMSIPFTLLLGYLSHFIIEKPFIKLQIKRNGIN